MKQLAVRLATALLLLALIVLAQQGWSSGPQGAASGSWGTLAGLLLLPALALWLLSGLRQPTLPLRRLPFCVAGAMALSALLIWALREAGVSATAAIQHLLVLAIALAAVGLLVVWRVTITAEAEDAWLLAVTAALGLLMLGPVWGNMRLVMGSHGLWHTASGLEALRHVPPENPVFAGRLAYLYWGYDLFIAQLGLAAGRTAGEAGLLLNAVALWPLVVGGYELGALCCAAPVWRWLAAAITVGGVNGLGFAWLLVRVLTRQAPLTAYLWGDRLTVWALKLGWTNCDIPLEGHGEVGGAGVGLSLFVVGLVLMLQAPRERPDWWRGALLLLCVAGGIMLHPISGGMLVPLAFILAALWATRFAKTGFVPNGVWLLAAVLGGLLVAMLHVRELQTGFQQESMGLVPPDAGRLARRLWDLVGPWLWALPFALPGLFLTLRRRGLVEYVVATGAVLLTFCALLVNLPYDNHYKFVVLLSPFMAVLVPMALAAWRAARLRNVVVAALIALLSLTAFLTAPVRARSPKYAGLCHYAAEDGALVASPDLDPAARAMYGFIATRTAPDAIVLLDPTSLQQNTELLEVPLLAQRQLFTATSEYWMSGGYLECAARVALVRRLSAGEPLSHDQWQMLRALGRPLFLLLRQPAARDLTVPRVLEQVFASGAMKLYAITPAGTGP